MKTNNPDGTIWAPGTHQIYMNKKPGRLYASPDSVIQTYSKMQETIRNEGHINLGFDHVDETVLETNPILAKTLQSAGIDPYNVGEITKIGLDGDRIKIVEAKITNPHVQKLYDNGEIPAYSIVGPVKTRDCTTGKADKIVDEFGTTKRVDFVVAGGCTDCRTENNILLAKLSLEDDTLTETEIKDKINEEEDIVETEEESVDETSTEEEEESTEEEEESTEENQPVTLESVKQLIIDTVTPLIEGNNQAVEAKLAEFKEDTENVVIEAKTSKIETLVEAKIAAGYATPAMKKGLVANGLGSTDDEFKEVLASLSQKIWDGEQHSNQDKPDGDGNYDEKAYLKECEKHGLDPI